MFEHLVWRRLLYKMLRWERKWNVDLSQGVERVQTGRSQENYNIYIFKPNSYSFVFDENQETRRSILTFFLTKDAKSSKREELKRDNLVAMFDLCAAGICFVWLRKTVLFFFRIIEVLRSFAPDYLPATRKKSKQMTQNSCLDNRYVESWKL